MDPTTRPLPDGLRVRLALATLFLGAFVMGSAELVVVGLLDRVAHDTRTSLDTAGLLVTAYALGISLGGPLLTAATMRLRRRTAVWLSLAGYAAGNLLAAVSGGFAALLVVRAGTGALQGLFLGAAFSVAGRLVPAERLGRAIAVVFGGIASATALGVPLGTLAGQRFGWQWTFAAIGGLSLLALLAALLLLPATPETPAPGPAGQARYAFAPRVLALLGVGFLLMGGQFAALTYLTPLLSGVTGVSDGTVDAVLLVYGLATAVGTFVGGRVADRAAATALVAADAALIVAIGTVRLTASHPLPVTIATALWGLVGFGLVPSLQHRVTLLAGPGRDLAATLPASAVNAGIAAGAWGGGVALRHAGPVGAVTAALVVCAAALPLTWLSRR
ncbi:MFS transporter, partial [Streptacidiphilus anmyonensis]|uniref:MFS transporter n=1 Tax=Streptacidiphilus anmyonensis TaxID=405782 RepID=UPI0006941E05